MHKNRDYVLGMVRRSGIALEHAAPELRDDAEVVFAAISQTGVAAQYASSRLRRDPDFMMQAFIKDHRTLKYAAPDLRSDASFMNRAMGVSSMAFMFLSEELKHNSEFMSVALSKGAHRDILRHVSPSLQANFEFVLLCVSMNGLALEHAGGALRDDKDIVLAAVRQNAYALAYASSRLKQDCDVKHASKGIEHSLEKSMTAKRGSTAPTASTLSNNECLDNWDPATSSAASRSTGSCRKNSLLSTVLRKSSFANALAMCAEDRPKRQTAMSQNPRLQTLKDALGDGLSDTSMRLPIRDSPLPDYLLHPPDARDVKRYGKLAGMTPATRSFVRDQAKKSLAQSSSMPAVQVSGASKLPGSDAKLSLGSRPRTSTGLVSTRRMGKKPAFIRPQTSPA